MPRQWLDKHARHALFAHVCTYAHEGRTQREEQTHYNVTRMSRTVHTSTKSL